MRKIFIFISAFLLSIFSVPVTATDLLELDISTIAGYYSMDDESILLMPNGLAYSIIDETSIQEGFYQVIGDTNDFIVYDGFDNPLYFKKQNEKDGNFYAIYNQYLGNIGEIDYKEGKNILYGSYIFGNDYEVAQKDSLASFWGIKASDTIIETGKIEGIGYDTPEAATCTFINALKSKDLNQMIAVFAVESLVEHVDVKDLIELKQRYQAYGRGWGWSTNTGMFGTSINILNRQKVISTELQKMLFLLIKSRVHTYGDKAGMVLGYEEKDMTAEEFVDSIFPDNNKPLEIIFNGNFIMLDSLLSEDNSEKLDHSISKEVEFYHADEYQYVAALLSINHENYILCMDTIKYGDRWYILDLGGIAGDLLQLDSDACGLKPLTEQEYDELLQNIYEAS